MSQLIRNLYCQGRIKSRTRSILSSTDQESVLLSFIGAPQYRSENTKYTFG